MHICDGMFGTQELRANSDTAEKTVRLNPLNSVDGFTASINPPFIHRRREGVLTKFGDR